MKDEGHRSPLHLACLGGHKDVAQYLVEKAKCDVSKWINFTNEMHILSLAKCLCTHISLDMRDKNNRTPLHKSCGSSRCALDMVQYLVENTNCDVSEWIKF